MTLISEFKEGDSLTTQLLVGNVAKCVNNTGGAYLNIELRDCSGVINAKKWEISDSDEKLFVVGNIVEVEIEVLLYRSSLQAKILSAKLVDCDAIDINKFVKQPPVKKEELIERLNKHISTIKNEDCQKLLKYFFNKFGEKIYVSPAASSIHHEYSSGLLMHIVSMCDIAVSVMKLYDDINHDLLLTGIILHDFGKMIELEGKVIYKYSLEGKLLGHISIMMGELRLAQEQLQLDNELMVIIEHMILSHHGYLEYGSPELPLVKEALLLSLIDNLDSKMVIASKALEGIEKGEFTQKIFALDSRCLYNPKIK